MKKRRMFITLISLFSLITLASCDSNIENNDGGYVDDEFEQDDPNKQDDDSATITLSSYEGDNYTFDSNITNENGSVSYEIFVRSFYDSDGDGIGDLDGVSQKLDYLEELGIKTVWLMPIMPSPTYHGYDVTDYYSINEDYGTMADFEDLIENANKHNIDIMIDIVFNHSSTENPWFKESYEDYIANDTSEDSKKDWYCWSDSYKSGYYIYSGSNSIYYEARFDYSMPDFNTSCEAVREEMVNILDFWANKGVKGFRFDAVKYYEYENTSYNTEFLSYLHDEIVKKYPDTYFVGECMDSRDKVLSYYNSTFESFFKFDSSMYGNGNSLIVSQVKLATASNTFGDAIETYEAELKEKNPNGYSSYFISNHDMDRASNYLVGDNAKMAASLTYLLPGTPYIYYGEEIMLKGKRITSPDDQSDVRRRLPMIWSSTVSTGLCDFPEKDRQDLATNDQVTSGVEDALLTGYSVLNHYKKVINIRNKYPFIKNSVFTNKTDELNTKYKYVLAYELSYGDESIVVIHNFQNFNIELDVSTLGTKIDSEVSCNKLISVLSDGKLKMSGLSTVILTK